MKKFLVLIGLLLLTGCSAEATAGDDAAGSADVNQVSSDTGDYSWSFNDTTAVTDAEKWKAACEDIKAALGEISWVETVAVAPEDYEDYQIDKSVSIQITIAEGAEVSGQEKEGIESYLSSTGCFETFSIQYSN